MVSTTTRPPVALHGVDACVPRGDFEEAMRLVEELRSDLRAASRGDQATSLLLVVANGMWRALLRGGVLPPAISCLYQRMRNPQLGDMVIAYGVPSLDPDMIGRLVGRGRVSFGYPPNNGGEQVYQINSIHQRSVLWRDVDIHWLPETYRELSEAMNEPVGPAMYGNRNPAILTCPGCHFEWSAGVGHECPDFAFHGIWHPPLADPEAQYLDDPEAFERAES